MDTWSKGMLSPLRLYSVWVFFLPTFSSIKARIVVTLWVNSIYYGFVEVSNLFGLLMTETVRGQEMKGSMITAWHQLERTHFFRVRITAKCGAHALDHRTHLWSTEPKDYVYGCSLYWILFLKLYNRVLETDCIYLLTYLI